MIDAEGMSQPADEPHTIGRWLEDRAGSCGDRIAIDDRGVRVGYRLLFERARLLTERLRAAGYGPGDRVATVSGNSIDHVVAFFACAMSGIAFIPLSWRQTTIELASAIGHCNAQLLLIDEEYAGLVEDARRNAAAATPTARLGVAGVEAHPPARHGRFGPAPRHRPVRDDDVALVIFTSGSEGMPKGVMLTHANCFWNNLALAGVAQLTAQDVVLATLPQFHVAAWNVQPLLAWWTGATVVLERSFQPDRVLQLIAARGVTAMMGVPTQYRLLADDPRFAASDLSTLRLVQVGGAPLPPDLREIWSDRGVELLAGYGLTEAGPNALSVAPGQAEASAGTVGMPYPTVDVAVVDPATGLAQGDGAVGELWVRGPSVFAGYLDDPDATAHVRDGQWLRTGDLARRDEAGRFVLVDRIKDIYISGGENVAPAEVERALCAHPLVQAAAVVGVPDRVWGERGVAFVQLRAGAVCGADELMAHARAQLSSFKVPVHIEQVADLPRSGIDKVARTRLREQAAAIAAHHEGADEDAR
ncbi:class I adenylate-forming enzyme family protein [Microbacterium terrisoli]|uniref:class I adenylate-forming enzyme family protein n=1 Tax=Microbacterium terrisoli TaxID=3242192 RepID=UPI0028060F2A|nr:class I adenylate-forming enzyme family protein [Microbacterium protaetiae]